MIPMFLLMGLYCSVVMIYSLVEAGIASLLRRIKDKLLEVKE